MFKWPKRSRDIQITVRAVALDPAASYIIVANPNNMAEPAVKNLMKDLRKTGVKNVVAFMLSGSPDDAIQVIEKGKKHATSKTRRKH